MSRWPYGAFALPRPGACEIAVVGRDGRGEHAARDETFAEDWCPITR